MPPSMIRNVISKVREMKNTHWYWLYSNDTEYWVPGHHKQKADTEKKITNDGIVDNNGIYTV